MKSVIENSVISNSNVLDQIDETVRLCPKCMGQGIIGYPPNVPYGMPATTNQTTWLCDVCFGRKFLRLDRVS